MDNKEKLNELKRAIEDIELSYQYEWDTLETRIERQNKIDSVKGIFRQIDRDEKLNKLLE